MAYQKKTWLARLGQGLNKFIFNGGSKVTLDSSPDVVTQEGTPLSADNMNDLEQRIEDEFTNVNSAVTSLIKVSYQHETLTFSDGKSSKDYASVLVGLGWTTLLGVFWNYDSPNVLNVAPRAVNIEDTTVTFVADGNGADGLRGVHVLLVGH